MKGIYGKGKFLPRVLQISIARFQENLPEAEKPLEFLVSIHEEGMGITWQRNIPIAWQDEKKLLKWNEDLRKSIRNVGLVPKQARALAQEFGSLLYDIVIGTEGQNYLDQHIKKPTAILFSVDETIMNLPWELISHDLSPWVVGYPFGRLITTREIVRPGKNPQQEDTIAADVLKIKWNKGAPYFVFNSACRSAAANPGQRLVRGQSQTNGLAAAFLAAGVYAYAGFTWPVPDDSAEEFTRHFYPKFIECENLGEAFMHARVMMVRKFESEADLTAFSAVLYGDAASSHRRDLGIAS